MPSVLEVRKEQSSVGWWLLFVLLVATGLAFFLIPAYVIRPFRGQSSGALRMAMAVRQQAPLWTVLIAVATLLLGARLWVRAGRWTKAALMVGALAACAAGVMARVNYFEWMFHPVAAPGFQAAEKAGLSPSEMVLAVQFAGDGRAYPIREMAYHHIVNDVVGGVPIAVTY